MDRLIYTAMSGASAAAHRQSVLANNLANASTGGFRAELSTFRAVPLRGNGATTRVFALEATAGHLDTPGPVQRTGRNLDVMAGGQAWFAVQGLDGTEAYTRNGALEVSPEGALVNSGGLAMMSEGGGPINVPAGSELSVAADGTLTATQPGRPPASVGRLKLITASAEQALQRGPDGLFRSPAGDTLPADPNARLQTGALEGSNVNPVDAMVGMIQVARQFETQMRLLQTAEANDKSASQLLGLQ